MLTVVFWKEIIKNNKDMLLFLFFVFLFSKNHLLFKSNSEIYMLIINLSFPNQYELNSIYNKIETNCYSFKTHQDAQIYYLYKIQF